MSETKRNNQYEDLISFILEARKRGFSDPEIITPLLKQGWPDSSIDKAFSIIKEKQSRKSISITIDSKVYSLLRTRSKKNLLTLEEQIEDILRRSCINTKHVKKEAKLDDLFVSIFSRRKYQNKK